MEKNRSSSAAGSQLARSGTADRVRAQRWFTEPGLVPISTAYDSRVTTFFGATMVEIAKARLSRPPSRVLDVGCGRGDVLGLAARRFPDAELLGVDPSADAVATAVTNQGESGRIRFRQAAAEDLSDAETAHWCGQPDLVLVHLSLALWPAPVDGLVAAISRMAPGGLCYVLDVLRPADEDSATPYFAAARNTDEIRYLEDQMATWYSHGEISAIVGEVCAADSRITSETCYRRLDELAAGFVDTPDEPGGNSDARVSLEDGKQVGHLFFRR